MKKIALILMLMFTYNTPVLSWGVARLFFSSPTKDESKKQLTDLEGYNVYWKKVGESFKNANSLRGTECLGCSVLTVPVREKACLFLNPAEDTRLIIALTSINKYGESKYSQEVFSDIYAVLPYGNIDTTTLSSVDRVDGYDLSTMLWYFGRFVVRISSSCSDINTLMASADLDGDGWVDIADMTMLSANFGATR